MNKTLNWTTLIMKEITSRLWYMKWYMPIDCEYRICCSVGSRLILDRTPPLLFSINAGKVHVCVPFSKTLSYWILPGPLHALKNKVLHHRQNCMMHTLCGSMLHLIKSLMLLGFCFEGDGGDGISQLGSSVWWKVPWPKREFSGYTPQMKK
jgi:hypothetical protein